MYLHCSSEAMAVHALHWMPWRHPSSSPPSLALRGRSRLGSFTKNLRLPPLAWFGTAEQAMDVPAEQEGMDSQRLGKVGGTDQGNAAASAASSRAIPTPPAPAKPAVERAAQPAGTGGPRPPLHAQGTQIILGVCVVDFVCECLT